MLATLALNKSISLVVMKKIILLLTIALLLIACNPQETGQTDAQQGSQDIGYSTRDDIQEVDTMVKQVHAAHILVKTESEAKVILFDLKKGASFEDIAKEKSTCPSGKKGGDLGWFGRCMMVKEFEDAAFSTPKGELSNVVKTQFGYHIIKVLDTK